MTNSSDNYPDPRPSTSQHDSRVPAFATNFAPGRRCQAYRSVELFGVVINSLTVAEVFEAIDLQIQEKNPGYIVTPNVDHICLLQNDITFRNVYKSAFLALPDSTPLMWASWLLGRPLRKKISGSDLIYLLCEHAAKQGHRVFFLGGVNQSVVEETAARLRERYPGLIVSGAYSPPFGFENEASTVAEIEEILRLAEVDICFTALGAPRQDYWNSRVCETCGIPVMLGVGAAFDFVTGRKRRAPRFFQKAGLEWAWRLCLEPRRLWKRYLVRDSLFFWLLIVEMWNGIFGKSVDE